MGEKMNRQFVEDQAMVIDSLPFMWKVNGPGLHYGLGMKMSQLKQLAFTFEFGSVDPRIVKLDISLNELEELKPEALFPFENLSELDASLNALGVIRGIGILPNLTVLNLSYNGLRALEGLENCTHLCVLNVSHNKLRSLEGIQNLPQLCELYVQKNQISSLLPLSSSLALNVLDASGNEIGSLRQALNVVGGLRRLKHLKLQTKEDLKQSAWRIFEERLQDKKEITESAVHHLHSRMLDLQEELREYEETFRTEVDGCIRYIDSLPPEVFQGLVHPQEIPSAMEKYTFTKFWERWEHGRRKLANIPYKELTKPEEESVHPREHHQCVSLPDNAHPAVTAKIIDAAARLLSNPPHHPPPGDTST